VEAGRECGIDAKGLAGTSRNTTVTPGSAMILLSGRNDGLPSQLRRPGPQAESLHRPIRKSAVLASRCYPEAGTFAGLKTDAMARVVDRSGKAIDGLYAAGNDQASVMAGTTRQRINLGQHDLGFIAARHAARLSPASRGREPSLELTRPRCLPAL
jgi:hypothetical protein